MIKPVDDRVNVRYHRIDFTFGFYSPAGFTHDYPFRIPLKTPGTDFRILRPVMTDTLKISQRPI